MAAEAEKAAMQTDAKLTLSSLFIDISGVVEMR
jgi:hypothetical protein